MTEQTVHELAQRVANVEELLATAQQATRDAGSRAQAAENRVRAAQTAAGAAGIRQGSARAALVDTRLSDKPRTFSGVLADWKSWRFTFAAFARAVGLMERAVETDTDGEMVNVQLSIAQCPCNVL